MLGWDYPRLFSVVVHGDTEGVEYVSVSHWLTSMDLIPAGALVGVWIDASG
jgi:hypothetical protein